MWVTDEQAAEIYARFCKARYGSEAMTLIKARVAELNKRGDKKGERIWSLVAQKLDGEPRLHSAA